jgi:hypothetical protein
MGNRGCIHRGYDIVRPWASKRWITCVLEFRGWRAPQWEPGRWTALFFDDEAVAFAAGHRPCALCRRQDYERYRDAWQAASGARLGADAMDAQLHADRTDGRAKRLHAVRWPELPDGVFVEVDGRAARVDGDELRVWSGVSGYDGSAVRPRDGTAVVITPAANVAVLRAGYVLT